MLGYGYLCGLHDFDRMLNSKKRLLNKLLIKADDNIRNFNKLKELFDHTMETNSELPEDFFVNLDREKIKHRSLLYQINDNYNIIKEYIDDDLKTKVILYRNELNYGLDYKPKISRILCSLCRQNNNYIKITLDKDICPICISDEDDKEFCKLNICNHIYHLKCMEIFTSHKNIEFIIK